MTALPPYEGPRMVTLLDGRIVFSDSEEWRAETEARDCAAMPFAQRKEHFDGVERARGKEAAARLRAMVDEVIAVTAERAR